MYKKESRKTPNIKEKEIAKNLKEKFVKKKSLNEKKGGKRNGEN